MPGKMFTCSICSKEVSKRQSNSLPNGTRACSTHPEAQNAAEEARRKVNNHLLTAEQRRKEEWNKKFNHTQDMPVSPLIPQCFCCNRQGLHQQDFAYRVLIAQQKMELEGHNTLSFTVTTNGKLVHNPKYFELMKEYMKSPDMTGDHIYVCLKIVDINKNKHIFSALHPNAKMAAELTGAAMLCHKCLSNLKINVDPENNPTLDQISRVAATIDIFKPELQKVAQQELETIKS